MESAKQKVIGLLLESEAMLEGHFLLSSGRHSNKYFQCARLLQYPDKARLVFEYVVNEIKNDIDSGKLKVDVVAGPAIGGIIASWEVARQLALPAIFTERDENGDTLLRRGFQIKKGSHILIVEDVVTTGKSSMECAEVLARSGGVISALASVVDRRAENARDIPWPFYPAAQIHADNWDASSCALCEKGIPFVKPGSRKITS